MLWTFFIPYVTSSDRRNFIFFLLISTANYVFQFVNNLFNSKNLNKFWGTQYRMYSYNSEHVTVECNVSPLCNRYLVLTSQRVREFITNCALFCPYKARIWPSGKLCALVCSVRQLHSLQTNSAFAIHESSLKNPAIWLAKVTVRIKAKYFYDMTLLVMHRIFKAFCPLWFMNNGSE